MGLEEATPCYMKRPLLLFIDGGCLLGNWHLCVFSLGTKAMILLL